MRRFLPFFGAAVVALTLVAGNAQAQDKSQWGIGLCYGSDTDVGIDARILLPIGAIRNFAITPNFDYFFTDGGTFFTLDGNINYTFMPFSRGGGLYGIAGLDIGVSKPKNFNSHTELGINLGGGVRGDAGPLFLFGELKFVLGDFDQVVLYGGMYFEL